VIPTLLITLKLSNKLTARSRPIGVRFYTCINYHFLSKSIQVIFGWVDGQTRGNGVDRGKKVDTVSLTDKRFFNYYSREIKKMIRTSSRAKPAFIAVVLGLLLSTTTVISSAEAVTIKNGVSCKKSGQTAKTGSKRYVCGKNPYVSPSKLTWMLRECPQSYELYVDSKEQYEIFKDILASSGTEGQAEASKLLKGILDLEALMKNQVCKRGR